MFDKSRPRNESIKWDFFLRSSRKHVIRFLCFKTEKRLDNDKPIATLHKTQGFRRNPGIDSNGLHKSTDTALGKFEFQRSCINRFWRDRSIAGESLRSSGSASVTNPHRNSTKWKSVISLEARGREKKQNPITELHTCGRRLLHSFNKFKIGAFRVMR